MIDTLEVAWVGNPVGGAEIKAFERATNGALQERVWRQAGETEGQTRRWIGYVDGIGQATLNADGYFKIGGRSLAKVRDELYRGIPAKHSKNDEVLTADESNLVFQDLTTKTEVALPFLHPGTMKVQRADICYQRAVESSYEVFNQLVGAVRSTRKGVAAFTNARGVLTGFQWRGQSRLHRVYDKGIEGGNREFLNVVRSEEQIRASSVVMGQILDLRGRIFDRERCRDVLNERYLDVTFDPEEDVEELVAEGRYAVALFVRCPDLLAGYKANRGENAYYKMLRQIREHKSKRVPADLRIPEDAWTMRVA